MKIAFLLPDLTLSGGVNVVLKHAYRLAQHHEHEVSVVVQNFEHRYEKWDELLKNKVEVRRLNDETLGLFDVAIATLWETLFVVTLIDARKYIWFCQDLEHRFYNSEEISHHFSAALQSLPLTCITEATWIHNELLALNPDRQVYLVRNGIDKTVFHLPFDGRFFQSKKTELRILIEGSASVPRKGIIEALEGCLETSVPIRVQHVSSDVTKSNLVSTELGSRYQLIKGPVSFSEMSALYQKNDVLLKCSRAEGMFGPPLEAFHCGCTAIVTPVTGSEEYVVDGENSLVVGWDRPDQIGFYLDYLWENPQFLQSLKTGALATASRWPSWDESTDQFNQVLVSLNEEENMFSRNDLKGILNGLRSLMIPSRKRNLLLNGFVKVADERLEMIYELQRQNQILREQNEKLLLQHVSVNRSVRKYLKNVVSRGLHLLRRRYTLK